MHRFAKSNTARLHALSVASQRNKSRDLWTHRNDLSGRIETGFKGKEPRDGLVEARRFDLSARETVLAFFRVVTRSTTFVRVIGFVVAGYRVLIFRGRDRLSVAVRRRSHADSTDLAL